MSSPIKARVRALAGYGLEVARTESVKIDLNESPHDFPDDLKSEVWRRLGDREWSRYPEPRPRALMAALARREGWDEAGLLVGCGSNELLLATLAVTLERGDDLLVPSPTFEVYGILSTVLAGPPRTFELGERFEYLLEPFEAALAETRPRVVVLCSPNNPTGSVVPRAMVREALADRSRLVILDEAYQEFGNGSLVDMLPENPNLVVLRTFSKAWGLAGMRVGYLLAHPVVAMEIGKAVLPFNVGLVQELAALVALENGTRLGAVVARIRAQRDWLDAELAAIAGVTSYRSEANFILFEVDDPVAVWEGLRAQGVLVRRLARGPRLSRALRVTIGTDEENRRFLAALRVVLP